MPKVMAYVWFLTKEQSQIEISMKESTGVSDTFRERKGAHSKLGASPQTPGISRFGDVPGLLSLIF
jgi:hypothetical protein